MEENKNISLEGESPTLPGGSSYGFSHFLSRFTVSKICCRILRKLFFYYALCRHFQTVLLFYICFSSVCLLSIRRLRELVPEIKIQA